MDRELPPTGCYVSDYEGWRGIATMCLIAHQMGFPLTAEDNADLDAFIAGEAVGDGVFWIADDAEAWLNTNMRPEGATWYWEDGNFGLWEDDDE